MTVPRTALVTGGARGIGLACARRLHADGHRVAITYVTAPPPADALASQVLAVRGDVTDAEGLDAAVSDVEDRLGRVEILVSNAGISRDGLVVRLREDDVSAVLDTNLAGALRTARRVAPGMVRNRWGRMVFVSSVVGLLGSAGQAAYAASKAGLVGLARSLARELASRAVTANVVAPGPVDTDMTAALPQERRQTLASLVPIGRYVEADEVAAAVSFLASEDAAAITGAVLPVDGGLGMGH